MSLRRLHSRETNRSIPTHHICWAIHICRPGRTIQSPLHKWCSVHGGIRGPFLEVYMGRLHKEEVQQTHTSSSAKVPATYWQIGQESSHRWRCRISRSFQHISERKQYQTHCNMSIFSISKFNLRKENWHHQELRQTYHAGQWTTTGVLGKGNAHSMFCDEPTQGL